MITYVRRDASDTWHWRIDCSNYPYNVPTVAEHSDGRPTTGELCDQCLAKERKDKDDA